jgi:asparagine synthase (glutamine-hydrolysing)
MIPASARAKTKLRAARRWLEAVPMSPEGRYLRWMTSFDEETRAGLYTDEFLGSIGESAGNLADPSMADPGELLSRALGVARGRDPATRAMVADLLMYLPGDLLMKVDYASMAHSLEVRGPFLDHRLVELALAMPLSRKLRLRGGRSKVVLKQAFADLLPPAIVSRRKMGFGVPLDRWFRGPLAGQIREVLLDPGTTARGLFRREEVERMIDEHGSGARDHAYRLWALMMLELWYRRYGPGAS